MEKITNTICQGNEQLDLSQLTLIRPTLCGAFILLCSNESRKNIVKNFKCSLAVNIYTFTSCWNDSFIYVKTTNCNNQVIEPKSGSSLGTMENKKNNRSFVLREKTAWLWLFIKILSFFSIFIFFDWNIIMWPVIIMIIFSSCNKNIPGNKRMSIVNISWEFFIFGGLVFNLKEEYRFLFVFCWGWRMFDKLTSM